MRERLTPEREEPRHERTAAAADSREQATSNLSEVKTTLEERLRN